MKIGIVRNDLASAGGAERYTLMLLGRLRALGHEVHVFTAREPGELPEGTVLHLAPASARKSFQLGPVRLKLPRPPRAMRHRAIEGWLGGAVRSAHLDVLVSMERMLPSDVFRAGGGVHKAWLEISAQRANVLQRLWGKVDPLHRQVLAAEKELFRTENTRLVICNSAMVAEQVVRLYDYPRDRIRVVHNGVDLDRWTPAAPEDRSRLRLERGMSPDETALLFVGSGWWRKGLDIAIDLLAELAAGGRNARLYVVGRGEAAEYRKQVEARGVSNRVVFVGPLAPDKILPWYQSADALLFPSRYDPLPNVCLEAGACGLPVIVGAGTGFGELVRDNVNGVVLRPEWDAAACTAAILSLLETHLPADQVRAELAHLNLPAHIDKLLAILGEVTQWPGPAGL